MMGATSNSDSRAEGDLLRLIVEVVNVAVKRELAHWLQREILLWPHLQQCKGEHAGPVTHSPGQSSFCERFAVS